MRSVLVVLLIFFSSWTFAEEGSEFGFRAVRSTHLDACNALLKSSEDWEQKRTLPYAKKIAAKYLLFLTMDHPVVQAASSATGLDTVGLYHMTSGFLIRPSSDIKIGLMNDPTKYSKYVKASGWAGSIWKTNGRMEKYEAFQSFFDKARIPEEYAKIPEATKVIRMAELLSHSMHLWSKFKNGAEYDYRRTSNSEYKIWTENLDLAATEARLSFKNFAPAPQPLLDAMGATATEFLPQPRGFASPRFILSMIDLPDYYSEYKEVAEEARRLTVDFLVSFFPAIIQVRDQIMADSLEGRDMSSAIRAQSDLRTKLREQIVRLGNGEPLTLPNYSNLKLLAPTVSMQQLDGPAQGSALQLLSSDQLTKEVSNWSTSEAVGLEKTRSLLPLIDRVVDSLPQHYVLSPTVENLRTPEQLAVYASALQTYFHGFAEVCRRDIEKLSMLKALMVPSIDKQLQSLDVLSAELLTQNTDLSELDLEEAKLLTSNLVHAKAVFESRFEYQKKWNLIITQIQSLLRQYRQDLVTDPESARNVAQLLAQSIQSLHQIQLGQNGQAGDVQ